jgi:hypothetical protein
VTSLHAARVAADLREQLGEAVQLEDGRYGEFEVLVDGHPVVSGGSLAFLGVLPSKRAVREAVAAYEREVRGEGTATTGRADAASPDG